MTITPQGIWSHLISMSYTVGKSDNVHFVWVLVLLLRQVTFYLMWVILSVLNTQHPPSFLGLLSPYKHRFGNQITRYVSCNRYIQTWVIWKVSYILFSLWKGAWSMLSYTESTTVFSFCPTTWKVGQSTLRYGIGVFNGNECSELEPPLLIRHVIVANEPIKPKGPYI